MLEIKQSELFICAGAASFLQSAMWGEFKARFGWNAKAFVVDWQQPPQVPPPQAQSPLVQSPLLVLCRRLAPGVSFVYIPWGPQFPPNFKDEEKPQALAALAKKLKPFLARNTVFVRFEPDYVCPLNPPANQTFFSAGLKKASATVNAPDTVLVDLGVSCEEILAAMKSKWRYNISLAQKKGVKVSKRTAQELDVFYDLLKETAARDGIAVHSFAYYKTLFEVCENHKTQITLYTAAHEGDTLAGIIVLFRGDAATYLYGASSNNKRNLMAPYALQWKAMQDAKEAGCLYYDLFGIPPDDDPHHHMAGLYRFKTGFGGRIIHRPGTWDYPYKSFLYSLFNAAEKARKKIRDRKKHRAKKS